MRVVLFVEGGDRSASERLWNATLLPALGCTPVDAIVTIGKSAIARLCNLPTSSTAPGLDSVINQARRSQPLEPARDALVVAWDLEPIHPGRPRCAWQEKIDLYQALAISPLLQGTAWSASAQERAQELDAFRGVPGPGASHHAVAPGTVLGVCMEPMFEGLLAADGRAVRRALGLDADPRGWPTGWGDRTVRDPSKHLLEKAIASVRGIRPRPRVCQRIHKPWLSAKDDWCEYILRRLLEDERQADCIRSHPIGRRLASILPLRP